MAFLLIDAGNTRFKWATAPAKGPIRRRSSLPTDKVTLPQLRSLARQFPRDAVVVSCVVPRLLSLLQKAFPKRLILVRGDSPRLGLAFDYPKPAELGADRLAAAVAAQAEDIFPAIIVSCGTATAFTVLNPQGKLCGGAIAPGLQAQLDALLGATAQLPATALRPPKRLPSRSTQEAIRAGVWLSYQGGVQEILQRLCASLPRTTRPRILLTGGDAPALAEKLGYSATLRPLLVFEGLRIIGTRAFSSDLS